MWGGSRANAGDNQQQQQANRILLGSKVNHSDAAPDLVGLLLFVYRVSGIRRVKATEV